MRREIAIDIERKVISTVKETVARELEIARQFLAPVEIAEILMRLAKGTVGTAASTIAGMAEDPAGRPDLFDMVLDQLLTMARGDKAEAMEKVAAAYREAGR